MCISLSFRRWMSSLSTHVLHVPEIPYAYPAALEIPNANLNHDTSVSVDVVAEGGGDERDGRGCRCRRSMVRRMQLHSSSVDDPLTLDDDSH